MKSAYIPFPLGKEAIDVDLRRQEIFVRRNRRQWNGDSQLEIRVVFAVAWRLKLVLAAMAKSPYSLGGGVSFAVMGDGSQRPPLNAASITSTRHLREMDRLGSPQ